MSLAELQTQLRGVERRMTELRDYGREAASLPLYQQLQTRARDIKDQIREERVTVTETRSAAPAEPEPDPKPTATLSVSEARVYEPGNGRSYFQDLVRVKVGEDADGQAARRLRGHGRNVAEDVQKRDLDRTDGSGGQFVPPLWLMKDYVTLARAGRAYANLVHSEPLPPGTDSINVPKVSTGTAVAVQNGDNTAVQGTDLTDMAVNCPVRTIAGQQELSLQLLDQSPVSFDQVIFRDLAADYATKTDLQVIAGSGSNGQVTGIRNTSGITTISYTDSSPTVAKLYSKIADAVQRIHTSRFLPPTAIVMHPRRWAWFLAASDQNGRPLVVPSAGNPMNAIATLGTVGAEMVVGQMHGLPVITDPSIPTNLGAGTNEDVIHVLRASDLILYESGLRSRVLPDVGSGTLTVRLQVYAYIAFTAGRYPQSIVELGGSGLASPAF